MTTIATDGKTIAADTQANFGETIHRLDREKIIVRNRHVYALTGCSAVFSAVIQWHESGAKPEAVPICKDFSWSLLVVSRKRIELFSSDVPYPVDILPPFAMGSGEQYAFGVMDYGGSPKEAVECAIRRDRDSGGTVTVIDIAAALSDGGITKEAAE